jgi:nucleotide-binding universal stress UspA family protein
VEFERILVAIDGSPGAQRALETAIVLANLLGAELMALVVAGRLPRYAATIAEVDEARQEKDEFSNALARSVKAYAETEGIDLFVEVRFGPTARLLVSFAETHGADLVVIGRRRGFLGGTIARVARRLQSPVLVVG